MLVLSLSSGEFARESSRRRVLFARSLVRKAKKKKHTHTKHTQSTESREREEENVLIRLVFEYHPVGRSVITGIE